VVLKAVSDGGLVSLDCVVIDIDHFDQLVEGHISYIVLSVCQEPTKDVNAENSETLRGFNSHDGSGTFGKN